MRLLSSPPTSSPFTIISFPQSNKQKSQHLGFPKGLETLSGGRLSDSHSGYPSHGSINFNVLNQESLEGWGQLLREAVDGWMDGSIPLVSVLPCRGRVGVGITAVGWICPWQ